MTRNGEVNAIIILDNFSDHHVDKSKIMLKIFIKLLPSNVTSRHQPVYIGMLPSLKIDYKFLILKNLLDIFNFKGVFECVAQLRAQYTIVKKAIA